MTMNKLTADDPETRSPNLIAENVERLKELFPELVTEGPNGAAVNVDVLKALVGDATVTDADEKYGLTWHGKRRARQLALTPSTGTLRPCQKDSVDWDTTQNLMIEGDNLEVLKLLQKSYAGKVKLIYIDPPYNTGKDFVYPDDFKDNIANYLEITRQVDNGGRKLTSNTESSGRFHTAWLKMMYPRLKLARSLLRDDGAIFISIENTELSNLIKLMDEIFGEENSLGCLIWRKKEGGGMADAYFATEHEYVAVYRKSEAFNWEDETVETDEAEFARRDAKGPYKLVKLAKWGNTARREDRPSMYFPITNPDGKANYPIAPDGSPGRWRVGKVKVEQLIAHDQIEFLMRDGAWVPYEKIYFDPKAEKAIKLRSILYSVGGTSVGTNELTNLFGIKDVFQNPKPTTLISAFTQHNTSDGDVILDFFAGSGTTGHSVMAQNAADGGNRRYVLVQLPEPLDPEDKDQKTASDFCDKLGKPRNIAELTKERLRRAAKKIRQELEVRSKELEAKKAQGTLLSGDEGAIVTPNPSILAPDLGFRVFKLDSSNIRAWEPDRDDIANALFESVEHLKPGRSEEDIFYELLLKLGLDLCVPIETRLIAGKDVHAVGGGVMMACLSEKIGRADVEVLAQGIVEWRKALAPAGDTTCVFRDSAFADDVAKTNMAAILEQRGIANVRSL